MERRVGVDVSVVIPTWNNCARLAVTLDAFTQCRVPPGLGWELLLVDNNSTDGTRGVAADLSCRLPLVYLEEPVQGSGIARNRGIRSARGELVIFADDDVRPARQWLEAYWTAFRAWGPRFFFGGPLTNEYESPPDPGVLCIANRNIAEGLDLGSEIAPLGGGLAFMGANWAAATDALRRIGGFDPALALDRPSGRLRAGEDVNVMERLIEDGLSGIYLPNAHVFHFVPAYKCRPRYISEHLRALGVYALERKTSDTALKKRPRLRAWLGDDKWTAGAVGRLLVAMVGLGIRYLGRRLRGAPGHAEYVSLLYCCGRAQGYLLALTSVLTKMTRSSRAENVVLTGRRGGRVVRSPLRDL